jgi:hypothetical protein
MGAQVLLQELRNIKSTTKDLRDFGLSIGVVLALLGGLLFWYERPLYPYLLMAAAAFVLTGLVFPTPLKPLQRLWMTFAVLVGWFMTRLILTVLFFLVITPTGLCLRLFGKEFLDLKIDRSRKSYWNLRQRREIKPEEYERQF